MKIILQKTFCFVLFITGIVSIASGNDLIIADGSSGASIVIGVNASETEKYAAEELQRCIRIMSGTDLPIVTADISVSGTQIIIGTPAGNSKINSAKDKLQLNGSNDEQTAVLREGNILYLGGQTARAALYATYTFLEDVLGVRWLWPGESGEFIPKRSVVAVGNLSIFEVPSIRTRAFTNANAADPETGAWQARNKLNLAAVSRNSGGNSPAIKGLLKKGFQTRIAGHFVVLPESVLSAHPEYAALHNNSRSYSSANAAQLCWGNPGVQDEVADMIAGLWTASPFVDIIHFYPADNQSYCTDSLCQALAPDVSTRWQKFSQIVMEKVDQVFLGKRYWTYAYQGYKDVPQAVASRFESIGYALYEASYRHLLSSGFSGSAGAIAEIDGWKAKGADLGIRGYEYIMFRDPMFVPLVSWEIDQMKWLAEKGLTSYLSELRPFGSPSGAAPENTYWMCNRMNLYAAAKGMWNSDIAPDSLVKDWCKTIYGPAADEMTAYYWDIEQLWRNAPGDIQEYSKTPASQVNNFFSAEDFARLNGYFTKARTKLAGMNEELRNRTAAQIDLESRMLANWQSVYNFANNRAGRFETLIQKADTVDQVAWSSALKLPAFEEAGGETAAEQTIVSKLWTASDLHFRIICQDDNIASRLANAAADDDAAILADDCIELYIQPDPDKAAYTHFAVNTNGKRYDAVSKYGGTDVDISWDPAWTAAVSVSSDSWTVDIKIPFSALGISAGDSTWFKMALKRSRAGRAENSGWPDASYYNPAGFGFATLVSEVSNPAANRIILYDRGGTSSANVSTEFQQRDWQVVSGINGEDELREKLNEDAAVLLIRYGSTSPLLSSDFYLNEIKKYIEKGRVVIISTARNIPIDEWFPGTPAVTWSGNSQHISASKSDYQLPGAWQTYPNNISSAIRTKQTPVSAYLPQAEGWRVLLTMPLKNGTSQPFLLSRRIGDGLLVLTSSNMGYSGGYEMFGSRNITTAAKLVENFKAEQESFPVKQEQTITMDSISVKIFGEPDFEVAVTSDSGLPVTLSSSDSTTAVIINGKVHLTGVGAAIITASQDGNETYKAAENISRELVVIADTIAPGIPTGLTAAATDSTVALSWNPSYDFIGVIGYKIYKDDELIDTSNVTSVLVRGLSSSVSYTFKVTASDAAGNESSAASIMVKTPDTQAPEAPLALTAEKTNKHKAALNWQPATDNVGVIGYNIYRNEEQLNASIVTSTGYLAERPRGKDVYEFTVKALDAAGNTSPASNSVISANGKIKNEIASIGNVTLNNISTVANEELIVYPNPSDGSFMVNINTNRNGELTISIFSTSGTLVRNIKDVKQGSYQKEVNVNDLPAGMYVVRVNMINYSKSKTIIIN